MEEFIQNNEHVIVETFFQMHTYMVVIPVVLFLLFFSIVWIWMSKRYKKQQLKNKVEQKINKNWE